jgi:prepilin-type N-terminal cleavage/methylation domain-containing protein
MPRKKGFTILELLITIAIVAIITTFAVITFPGTQAAARDSRRKTDLRQFQSSLEVFANKNNGLYPNYSSGSSMSTLCATLSITGACVDDPKPPSTYRYISTGGSGAAGSATATTYLLYATLEKQVGGASQYWVLCSTGSVGRIATASWTPSGTCPNNLQ